MVVVDPASFFQEFIEENWDASICHWTPQSIETRWIVDGDPFPLVTITMPTGDLPSTGQPAKDKFNEITMWATVWSLEPKHRWDFDRQIMKMVTENNYKPTTSSFPTPGIRFIDVTNFREIDDHSMSEVVFRKDMIINITILELYT